MCFTFFILTFFFGGGGGVFLEVFIFATLWNSALKMTLLFRRCLTLFISTLKHTTLIWLCSTLQIPTLKYTTLFQRWFDVVLRHNHCVKCFNFTKFPCVEILWKGTVSSYFRANRSVSTKWKRWNNVKMFAG